jgi:hypothetical protein
MFINMSFSDIYGIESFKYILKNLGYLCINDYYTNE